MSFRDVTLVEVVVFGSECYAVGMWWESDIWPGDVIVEWRDGMAPSWWEPGMSVVVLSVGEQWITVQVDGDEVEHVKSDSWESRLRYG